MSKRPVRRALATPRAGVKGANQSQGSPQKFWILTRPRALAVRARNWVAMEISGHKSPNGRYGVRPRRDGWVWCVQINVGGPPSNSGSVPGRVHWRSVRGFGWP